MARWVFPLKTFLRPGSSSAFNSCLTTQCRFIAYSIGQRSLLVLKVIVGYSVISLCVPFHGAISTLASITTSTLPEADCFFYIQYFYKSKRVSRDELTQIFHHRGSCASASSKFLRRLSWQRSVYTHQIQRPAQAEVDNSVASGRHGMRQQTKCHHYCDTSFIPILPGWWSP